MHPTPPPICRQCETPLVVEPINACCNSAAIAADLALDLDKAQRRNREEQAMAMRLQHRYQSTEYA